MLATGLDYDIDIATTAARFRRRLLVAHCRLLFHDRLLQMYVDALRIQSLTIRQCEQGLEKIAADLGIDRPPCHAKMVATAGDFHAQAGFYLSKVFVELAAEVGQTLIVGGLKNDVP